MTKNPVFGFVVVALIAALVAAYSWHHARRAIDESRTQVVANELQPIAMMLKENQALIQTLQSEPFTEKDSGILESYLAKIRRDGVAILDVRATIETRGRLVRRLVISSSPERRIGLGSSIRPGYGGGGRGLWLSSRVIVFAHC